MISVKQELEFYPYWVFEEDDSRYIMSSITNKLFRIDDTAYEFLQNYRTTNPDFDYQGFIEEMENAYIIKNEANLSSLNEISNYNEFLPSSLVLMVCQECNLRCRYCYGNDGEYNHRGFMQLDTAKAGVDFLFKHATSMKKLNICFFGGEPLLSFDLIAKVMDYADKKAFETGQEITYSMTTNGTLINPKIEKFITEHKLSVQISMDGTKQAQNANRFYSNQQGSYDDVVKNTASLRNQHKLSARATVSPYNCDIMLQLDHLLSLGFTKVAWANADNLMSDSDLHELERETIKLIDYIEELIKCNKYKEVRRYSTIYSQLLKIHQPALRFRPCGAGINMITVNIDGDIFPCQRFVGIEKYNLGNVSTFNSALDSHPYNEQLNQQNFIQCNHCIIRSLCSGGCVNENYYSSGEIYMPRSAGCNFNRTIFKRLVRLYVHLSTQTKESLFV